MMSRDAGTHPQLVRKRLELKKIINFASEADLKAWPPPPPWEAVFNLLKDAIEDGDLPARRHPSGKDRFSSVSIRDLSSFLARLPTTSEELQRLREFCRRWAMECGVTLPDPAAVAANQTPSTDGVQSGARNSELQKLATALRNEHPDWLKAKIATHIANNHDYQKLKGQGALSADAIEREIRVPRRKRGIDRRTP